MNKLFQTKYLARYFLLVGLAVALFWVLPTRGADGSGWVGGIAAGIGLFIVTKNKRNTGQVFTDRGGR